MCSFSIYFVLYLYVFRVFFYPFRPAAKCDHLEVSRRVLLNYRLADADKLSGSALVTWRAHRQSSLFMAVWTGAPRARIIQYLTCLHEFNFRRTALACIYVYINAYVYIVESYNDWHSSFRFAKTLTLQTRVCMVDITSIMFFQITRDVHTLYRIAYYYKPNVFAH